MKRYLLFIFAFIFSYSLVFAQSDTTINEKHYTRQQLNEDVTYLVTTLEAVHPDLYHNISKKRYQQLTDSIRNVLHDDMFEKQAWQAISRLIGALNEGHSVFSYPDDLITQLKNGSHHLFPVLLQEYNGINFIVRADASNENLLQPGDQITAINGIPSAKLMVKLGGYAGGLPAYKAIDICRNFITYVYLYQLQAPYRICYVRNGKKGNATVNNISWDELRTHIAAKAKTLPKQPKQDDLSFSYPNKDNAYLVINSLTASPDNFKHFLDSCFTKLKSEPTHSLIIDLRRNGGGNSALAEILLGYITDKPFRMTGGVRWKVSQAYKDQLNERLKGEGPQKMAYYFDVPNGDIMADTAIKIKRPADNPLRFNGRFYVLIGPHTFSSANMLANTIQDYHLATLVGQPSGEPANDYGELILLKLPHTGFSCSTSTKQFIRANGNTKDQHPVIPDYFIKDNPLTPTDEVLNFCLGLK